jgi:hypothetical protein
LFEPCFTRRGTGHDKGGVEARGKGIRWQHLVPIPSGETLEAINGALSQRLADQAAASAMAGPRPSASPRSRARYCRCGRRHLSRASWCRAR